MKRIISAALAVVLLIPQMSASADITTEQVCEISDSVVVTGEVDDTPDIADEVYNENSEPVDESESETDFFADIAEYGEAVTPLNITSGQIGDNVFFTFNETTRHLNITGHGEMWRFGGFGAVPNPIPRNVQTATIAHGVTNIGSDAFSSTQLRSITIPNSVTTIEPNAFSFTELTSVRLPESIGNIASPWFIFSPNIEYFWVHPNNWTISSQAGVLFGFNQTMLMYFPPNDELRRTQYVIPNTVTNIRDFAFLGARHLTRVNIPANVERIGNRAFCDCRNVVAFTVHPNNQHFSSRDGVMFNRDQTLLRFFPISDELRRTRYIVPQTVTNIDDHAFANSTLTDVVLSSNVTRIQNSAFWRVPLQRVVIPASMTNIEPHALQNPRLYFISDNISNVTIGTGNNVNRVIGWTPFNISETWNRVDIEVDAINPLEQMRFAPGNRNAAFFRNGGGTEFSAGSMTLPLGVYTFYSRDVGGNETVQTFTVTMVDTLAPTITANWSGTWARSKFINVTAQDR